MRHLYANLLATVIEGGVAIAGDPVRFDVVRKAVTWGTGTRVVRVRHLRLGGQPDEPALQTAKQQGAAVVIDLLRGPGESSWARGFPPAPHWRYSPAPSWS